MFMPKMLVFMIAVKLVSMTAIVYILHAVLVLGVVLVQSVMCRLIICLMQLCPLEMACLVYALKIAWDSNPLVPCL